MVYRYFFVPSFVDFYPELLRSPFEDVLNKNFRQFSDGQHIIEVRRVNLIIYKHKCSMTVTRFPRI